MASTEILVSADDYEVRVAILEDGRLAEYLIERTSRRRLAGNLYLGRVTSIVPGMEAAFVEIGQPKNAYLYVDDAGGAVTAEDQAAFGVDDEDIDDDAADEDVETLPPATIADLLKEGQDLLVQVFREPVGRKGCRVTANIALPGRCLVLLPFANQIGISRRITDEAQRESLRESVRDIVEEPMGAIVRTAALDVSDEQLQRDYDQLLALWKNIQSAAVKASAPHLIHEDRGLIYRLVRDVIKDDVARIVVDDVEAAEKITSHAELLEPSAVGRIERYDAAHSLFESRGVEAEIAGLLSKRVWLSCGGYIVIEETEALVAIDVNTGRYVGHQDLEQTVYRANLEAATEIARQIRLRNLGGIIVIDFIDMAEPEHREAVVDRLRTALSRDRSRWHLYELTSLGLLQLTRRRTHPSLSKLLKKSCPTCNGDGRVISSSTQAIHLLRTLQRLAQRAHGEVRVRVHPSIAGYVTEEHHEKLKETEEAYGCQIYVAADPELPLDQIAEDVP